MQKSVSGGYVTDYSSATGSNINYNKLSAKSRQLIRRSYELGDSAAGMRKLYEVGTYQLSTFYYLHDWLVHASGYQVVGHTGVKGRTCTVIGLGTLFICSHVFDFYSILLTNRYSKREGLNRT